MTCEAEYVESVRAVVATATRYWESREVGNAFNKSWEIHLEAAEEVARAAYKSSADPDDVPTLVRTYYRTLANAVRNEMTTKGVDCASARTLVAGRILQSGGTVKDAVRLRAYRAAAYLLLEAGDSWATGRLAMRSGACIGGKPVWDKFVPSVQAAASTAFATRAQPHEVPVLFGGFFAQFMANARTWRTAKGLSWGVAKARLVAQLLSDNLPADPVKAAAFTTAALLLAAIPDGSSSTHNATSSSSSAVRPEPRRDFAAAAATAATVGSTVGKQPPTHTASANTTATMSPPTNVSRTLWAKRRYWRLGPTNAACLTKSTNIIGTGGSVDGLQSTAGLSTSANAAKVTAGGAGITPRSHSNGLPHPMVAAPEYGTSEKADETCEIFTAAGVAPKTTAAEKAMGIESSATATGPTPSGAYQGVGALGFGSGRFGLDKVPGNASIASGEAPAAAASAVAATSSSVGAGAGVEEDGATNAMGARSLSSLLLDGCPLGPEDTEVRGVEPDVPVASEPTAAELMAAAVAAVTSSPVVAEAGVEGAGPTVATLQASILNNSEVLDALMPPISSGRETTGNKSGPDVDMGSDANGLSDGDGGSSLTTKRKADSSSIEGEVENHPCDGGSRKKARSG